jgi:hypothetical protein
MCEISAQLSRIALLVSAQVEKQCFRAGVDGEAEVVWCSERDKATKKALKLGGRRSLYTRRSLAAKPAEFALVGY